MDWTQETRRVQWKGRALTKKPSQAEEISCFPSICLAL